MVGDELESNGWLQGCVVKPEDAFTLIENVALENKESIFLIVASQSCDIANNNLSVDPIIEVSVAREITALDGNKSFNKNPRELHTLLQQVTGDAEVDREIAVELKACEKLAIEKAKLARCYPDASHRLTNKHLESYVAWLAARYSRPALPTEFNNRIAATDPKDKLKKKAKSLNNPLSGMYVEIIPDKEISPQETYAVNLLGLLSADFEGSLSGAQEALESYAEIMRQANMDVKASVRKEDEVSIALIKRFKRFYYDDLSIKTDAPLPVETRMNL